MRSSSYILESLLIQDLEHSYRSTFQSEFGYKRAFDLGGIGSDISSAVKDQVDVSSPGSAVETVAKFLVPGVLFKISPILSALDVAASFVGLDIVSLFEKFKNYILPKIGKGEAVDPSAITSLGKSIAGSMGSDDSSSDSVGATGFADLLTEIKKKGWGSSSPSTSPTIPFLGGDNSSWLARVFGDLFKSRAKGKARWLIVGFITWIVKTALLSAGLLAVGGVVAHFIHPGGTAPAASANTPSASTGYHPSESTSGGNVQDVVYHPGASTSTPASTPSTSAFPSSGRGEDQHVNDGSTSVWAVPVVTDTAGTLDAWIEDIYPSAPPQDNNPSFYKMIAEFNTANNTNTSTKQLIVPSVYKSRKQVVDKILSNRTS